MLVLSRKTNESIVIDGNIRITVVKSGGNAVRLGIVAPKDVTIHREEIQHRIASEERMSRLFNESTNCCKTQ